MNKHFLRMIRFGAVGVSNTLVDLGFFNLFLFFGLNAMLAASLSYFIATLNSYFFNRVWTFGDKRSKKPLFQYGQFLVSNFIGLGLNNLIVYYFTQHIEMDNTNLKLNIAKLIAITLVVVWNYLVSHYLIFRPHKPD